MCYCVPPLGVGGDLSVLRFVPCFVRFPFHDNIQPPAGGDSANASMAQAAAGGRHRYPSEGRYRAYEERMKGNLSIPYNDIWANGIGPDDSQVVAAAGAAGHRRVPSYEQNLHTAMEVSKLEMENARRDCLNHNPSLSDEEHILDDEYKQELDENKANGRFISFARCFFLLKSTLTPLFLKSECIGGRG
jgi:hypothetical protein